MVDYVLESNPALERLMERLRAKDEPPPPEERARAAMRTTPGGEGVPRFTYPIRRFCENLRRPTVRRPLSAVRVAEPATIVEVAPEVGEDDLWVVHEDPQPSEEVVPVEFDEERVFFDEDHVDDEVPVEVVGASENDKPDDERFVDEVVDWVLNALEDPKLDALDNDSVQEEAAVDGDEEEVDDDEVPVDVEGTFEDHESEDEELVVEDRELLDEGAKILDENQHEGDNGFLDAREGWRLAQRPLRYPDGREPPASVLEMVSRTGAAVVSVELVLDGERWLLTRQV